MTSHPHWRRCLRRMLPGVLIGLLGVSLSCETTATVPTLSPDVQVASVSARDVATGDIQGVGDVRVGGGSDSLSLQLAILLLGLTGIGSSYAGAKLYQHVFRPRRLALQKGPL